MSTDSRIISAVLAVSIGSCMGLAVDAGVCRTRHALVDRIDKLTLEDPEIKEYVETLPEAKQEALADMPPAKLRQALLKHRNRLKLRYVPDGGCVLPVPETPTPWINTQPQPISSVGLLPCSNSLEEARNVSRDTGKPVLRLSTELPGCSACTGHGRNQLSHPLVVDAAMEFVPVLVSGGWPYIVVEDADGKQLSPRMTHRVGVPGTLKGMADGLRAAGREVPAWLETVVFEWNTEEREKAVFGMGCFWSGERKLGQVDGVLSSLAGGLKGEVVEVEYDPRTVSYEQLLLKAREMKCASVVVARTDEQAEIAARHVPKEKVFRMDDPVKPAPTQGQKHSLGRPLSPARLVPMTELQATKVNSRPRMADTYLSPSQTIMKRRLQKLLESGADLTDLRPDRSREGLAAYAAIVRDKLQSFGGDELQD